MIQRCHEAEQRFLDFFKIYIDIDHFTTVELAVL